MAGTRLNPEKLYWGYSCKWDSTHQNENHKTLKSPGYGCLMCRPRYTGLTFEQIIDKVTEDFNNHKINSKEERRRKQIEHSRNWTIRNRDKHKEYSKRYYENRSEEQREKHRADARRRYHANAEKRKARMMELYYEKKAKKAAEKGEILPPKGQV